MLLRPPAACAAAAAGARRRPLSAAASASGPARRRPLSAAAATSSGPARRRRVAASASSASAAQPPVVIVGAGIAGLATAVALHRVGLPAVVLERGPGPRDEGAAIGLWANAWRALDALGCAGALRAAYVAPDRVEICGARGERLRAFAFSECEGGAGQEFRGVVRSDLLRTLAAALPAGTVRYGAAVAGVKQAPGGGGATVELVGGEALPAAAVVGADGVRSAVAAGLGVPAANYAGYTAYRGVASFPGGLPADMPATTIRLVWGAGVRAGMYALTPTSAYWYTCFNAPVDAPAPADEAAALAEALAPVAGWSWGIEAAIRATPAGGLARGRCADRWTAGAVGAGAVTLAGDALHPMTPNLGQGGCCSLEDAVALARALRAGADAGGGAALASALRRYEADRSARCLPLAVRSWAFGFALQIPLPPVTALRDTFIRTAFSPAHFLDHTGFDCGTL
jgi:2-polyprenyl-6-methoxyphenol hydroxylase-like FAD-dependent oxidoreductase